MFNSTKPSSTVVTLGNQAHVNTNDETYIMYSFAPKQGFSKFGSYTGNNNANGNFIYTGFRPAWVMIKNITVGGAIASDIHGKNHHQDGSFGNYVTHLTLIDGKGEIKQLGPGQDFTETERNIFRFTNIISFL